jgi:hypothetical protein
MKSRGRLFLFLILALAFGLWFLWPRLQSSVSLHNRSMKTIANLTITTNDESESFENIAPGETRPTKLHLGQKNRLNFKGEFADKTVLDKNVSFTRGASHELGQNVIITVDAEGNIQVDVQAPKG